MGKLDFWQETPRGADLKTRCALGATEDGKGLMASISLDLLGDISVFFIGENVFGGLDFGVALGFKSWGSKTNPSRFSGNPRRWFFKRDPDRKKRDSERDRPCPWRTASCCRRESMPSFFRWKGWVCPIPFPGEGLARLSKPKGTRRVTCYIANWDPVGYF